MNYKKLVITSAVTAMGFLGLMSTASASADEISHNVIPGDTVSTILTQYNIQPTDQAIAAVASTNQLQNVNLIYVGQTLTIDTNYEQTVTPQTNTYVQNTKPATVATAPVVQAPIVNAPVSQPAPTIATGSESDAKNFIAYKESSNNYNARNGQYIGKYQLTNTYLNGDYSPANQERVADNYVKSRYGSWSAAKTFWLNNGWY